MSAERGLAGLKTENPITSGGRMRPSGWVSWCVYGLVLAALAILPLRILRHGYLPPDDALRHAAKAVSGKAWQEILVMRPEITMDHNPGWHWILSKLHAAAGWDPAKLVAFSVVSMFLVFAVPPILWLRRPEWWLAALALVMVLFPYFADRAFVGRPLFLAMGASLTLLCLWTRDAMAANRGGVEVVSVCLFALSAWVHGGWYLMVLLPLAFLIAGAWRKGVRLTGCWLVGTLLGAALTGHPWSFLSQAVLIPWMALGQKAPLNSLVGEFQPFYGGYPAAILVGLVLVTRKLSGRPIVIVFRDPVFWLALMGWGLGFAVFRFWLDWGIPALTLWLARQFEEQFAGPGGGLTAGRQPASGAQGAMPLNSWGRLAVSGLAAGVLVLAVARDREGRWSGPGSFEALDASNPAHAGWVPDAGGILYAVNLDVFYQTFFSNPNGNWRYALGFEPSFMRPEDLAVYRELWRSLNAVKACAPWIERMKPEDRLVLRGGPKTTPALPPLEWNYAASNTWVGRRPRP